MSSTAIVREIDISTNNLLSLIKKFSDEQFNRIPFAGSWTAAQVMDHLLKAETWLLSLLTGQTISTDREPDEKVHIIRSVFLDFAHKLQSPPFIIPAQEPWQPAVMYEAFNSNRAVLRTQVLTLNLTETCTGFELPELGYLTREEWYCFAYCHASRHTYQLANIYQAINQA